MRIGNLEKPEFLVSLHWFRAITITFIVIGHAVEKLPHETLVHLGLLSFFSNSTFFFVFISGYLFWHLKDGFSYPDFLFKKFQFVISPYLIILSLTLLMALALKQVGVSFGEKPFSISLLHPFQANVGLLWHYWVGGSVILPFWYLPVIALIFISAFAINWVGNTQRLFWWVAFGLLILGFMTQRTLIDESPYLFPFKMYLHFIGVFFLGIAAKKYETFLFVHAKTLTIWFFIFFIATQGLYTYKAYYQWTNDVLISSAINLAQLKMLFGVLFFLTALFWYEAHLRVKHEQVRNINFFTQALDLLARYSFGLFFIHTFMLKAMQILLVKTLGGIYTVWQFTLLVGGTFALSIALIFVIKKVLMSRSRLVIGS